jgi:hypothetical protein
MYYNDYENNLKKKYKGLLILGAIIGGIAIIIGFIKDYIL